MDLFKCQTVEQFKIGVWLEEQGIVPVDIAAVEFPARDQVKIINPCGGYLVVDWKDGHAEINKDPEEDEAAAR